MAGGEGDGAKDGSTVGGVGSAGEEGCCGSVGENEAGEVDDGYFEGREIASHGGADAARAVGAEFDDAAGDDGVFGQEELIVSVDGVEQESA